MREFVFYCGYKIFENGDVITPRNHKMTPQIDRHGYLKVCIKKKGKTKTFFIHRLLALGFIDNIGCKPVVNHKNSIRTDNKLGNLEWCTQKENVQHGFISGRDMGYCSGENSKSSKLKSTDVSLIKKWAENRKVKEIASFFNVSQSAVYNILSGKKWRHI